MRISEQRVTTKNGLEMVLRTPETDDAEAIISFRRDVAGETIYLTRYPYEIENSPEKEREIISNYVPLEYNYREFSGERTGDYQ